MTSNLLLAFASYALVTMITPGPNNTLLLASGVNHGFGRTFPHLCGVWMGFTLMMLVLGSGLGRLFMAYPLAHDILRWVGAAYLLWLAWKIAHAAPMAGDLRQARPISFWQALVFQWVNPKCWVMVMGALTTYLPADAGWSGLAILTLIYAAIGAPCLASWVGCGMALRRWLSEPVRARRFNFLMAGLLVLSLYPLFVGALHG